MKYTYDLDLGQNANRYLVHIKCHPNIPVVREFLTRQKHNPHISYMNTLTALLNRRSEGRCLPRIKNIANMKNRRNYYKLDLNSLV